MSAALGQCKHFNGVQHKTCGAGVHLADVKGDNPTGQPFRVTWACLPEGQHLACPLREMPAPEEIAADQRETERAMAAIDKGLCPRCGLALVRRNHRKGGGYTAYCPACPDVGVRACGGGAE